MDTHVAIWLPLYSACEDLFSLDEQDYSLTHHNSLDSQESKLVQGLRL